MADPVLLRQGLVATPFGTAVEDVLLQDGLVRDRGPALNAPAGAEVVDADGLVILPGGVDELVHLVEAADRLAPADDLGSGTVAAAQGGTTTVVVPADDVDEVRRRATGQAFVDYAVLLRSVPDAAPADPVVAGVLLELDGPGRLGIEALFDALAAASAMRLPATVHGLAGGLADILERRRGAGHDGARPAAGEELMADVLGRWCGLAGSAAHALPVPSAAVLRALGPAVTASTSIAHLCLPQLPAGALLAPPHRGAAEVDALWDALADGRLQSVASDHRPPPLRPAPDAPPHVGIAGAALRLALLHTEGVVAGRIDLPRLAAITAEAPARRLGLWPRKGSLERGADADVVLLDPAARWSVTSARVEGRGRAPAFDGRDLVGRVHSVLSRGEWLVRDGGIRFRPGRGRPVTR